MNLLSFETFVTRSIHYIPGRGGIMAAEACQLNTLPGTNHLGKDGG